MECAVRTFLDNQRGGGHDGSVLATSHANHSSLLHIPEHTNETRKVFLVSLDTPPSDEYQRHTLSGQTTS